MEGEPTTFQQKDSYRGRKLYNEKWLFDILFLFHGIFVHLLQIALDFVIKKWRQRNTRCGIYRNLLSHFLDKNFVKSTYLPKKVLNSWFHEIFFSVRVNLPFFHTVNHNSILFKWIMRWTFWQIGTNRVISTFSRTK